MRAKIIALTTAASIMVTVAPAPAAQLSSGRHSQNPAATVAPADQATIKALVSRIYGRYHHNRMDNLDLDQLFSPSTKAIEKENTRLLKGEEGDIGSDIFLDAQDYGPITVEAIQLTRRPDGRVVAIVRFSDVENHALGKSKTIIWEQTPAGWKIYDLILAGQGSFRKVMLDENRKLMKEQAGSGGTSATASPRTIALPLFDLKLANPAAPLSSAANWAGVAFVSGGLSTVKIQIANANGVLSGMAVLRSIHSTQGVTLNLSGRSSADGACQLKIDVIGTFKGKCSSAGFVGQKKFLGAVEGSLFAYSGGVEAMLRAGASLPASFGYGGKSVAINGGYEMEQYLRLKQNGGVMVGVSRDQFSEAEVAGAAFDGSCVLFTNSTLRFEGACNSAGFQGIKYAGDKPNSTLTLSHLSDQAPAAGVNAQAARAQASMAAVQPYQGARDSQSSGAGRRANVVWALGHARVLAERGSCGAAVTIKGYCFADGAGWLASHPGKTSLDVLAMQDHWALGSFVPFNSGQGWDVYNLARAGSGYKADKHLHFNKSVRVPQGCLFNGVTQEAWLIGVARGRKVAIEATQYACDSWNGPAFASLRSDLEGEPFDVALSDTRATTSLARQSPSSGRSTGYDDGNPVNDRVAVMSRNSDLSDDLLGYEPNPSGGPPIRTSSAPSSAANCVSASTATVMLAAGIRKPVCPATNNAPNKSRR